MRSGEKSLVISKAFQIFKFFLLVYPDKYRKKFEQEMLVTFEDIYRDKLAKDGKAGFLFWFTICLDIIKSALVQHKESLKEQGMKKYIHKTLHFTTSNIIGVILLLPFLFLFGIDFLGRLVQGDFSHYNRAWYAILSHTFFYGNFPGQIPLMLLFLVLFPLFACAINIVPFFNSLSKIKNKRTIKKIFFTNPLTLLIVFFSFFCLLVVYWHDFAPCIVHGIMKSGFTNFFQLLSICRNA